MNTTRTKIDPVSRIVWAMDDRTSHSLSIDLIWQIADLLDAELEGLYIEDTDLLRLASLPFALEFDALFQTEKRLTLPDLEARMRRSAESVRQALLETSRARERQFSFKVVRGHILRTLVEATRRTDLLIMNISGGADRTESTTVLSTAALDRLIHEVTCPVLLARGTMSVDTPVRCVFSGDSASWKALEVAGNLARATSHQLRVLAAGAQDDLERVTTAVMEHLDATGLNCQIDLCSAGNWARWLRLHGHEATQILVVDSMNPLITAASLNEWLPATSYPVLISRADRHS